MNGCSSCKDANICLLCFGGITIVDNKCDCGTGKYYLNGTCTDKLDDVKAEVAKTTDVLALSTANLKTYTALAV